MSNFYKSSKLALTLIALTASIGFAQTTNISGVIKESNTDLPLPGVNIIVKDLIIGTISKSDGEFNLTVNQSPPFSIVFSMVGYKSQELEITEANSSGLEIILVEQSTLVQGIVISASRMEEDILRSPVTIEKVDLLTIRNTAAPEFFDALAYVKGVQVSSGSLNFNQVNTRGICHNSKCSICTIGGWHRYFRSVAQFSYG